MAAAEFFLVFSLMKLIRMMLAGTVLMSAACLVFSINRDRSWRLNIGVLCLVPAACLTGYSKIFFQGKLLILTASINERLSVQSAGLYFTAAGVLAVRFLYVHAGLRRSLKYMQQLEAWEYPVLRKPGFGPKIRVYLSENGAGPLAGGVIRPYIIIPKVLCSSLSEKELSAVLYHEVLHIRLGHVVLLNIYEILKIIWWIHPLIYLCSRRLRENIEYSSDEGSMLYSTLSAYEYGNVIIKTLQVKRQIHFVRKGITAFSHDSCGVLKKRIKKLGKISPREDAVLDYDRKKRILHIGSTAAVLILSSFILSASYPRYTKVKEISVFDENTNLLTLDLRAEGIRAEIDDGKIRISRPELKKLVSRFRPRGEYVIFCYDTIMKVPGVGGGGQAAMVHMEDPSDIFLLGRYDFADELAVFIMKYFL